MTGEAWCEDRRDPDEISRIPIECIGPIEAEGGPLAAWLVGSTTGTLIDVAQSDTRSLTPQEFYDFCVQGMRLALKGGAVPTET